VDTASLLLARGADPNASVVPVPVLFFAVKNSDSETVRQLLLRGAKADHISSSSVCTFLGSLYSLAMDVSQACLSLLSFHVFGIMVYDAVLLSPQLHKLIL